MTLPLARFVLVLALTAPALALASPLPPSTATINGSTQGNTGSPGGCSFDLNGGPSLGDGCNTTETGIAPTLSDASATAGPGYLQLSASSTAQALAYPITISAALSRAAGSFTEYLRLNAPQLAGKTAVLRGSVVVSGGLSADAVGAFSPYSISSALSSWSAQGGFWGANFGDQGSLQAIFGLAPTANNVGGRVFPIVANVSFDPTGEANGVFTVTSIVEAQAVAKGYQETSISPYLSGMATAAANFSNTIFWGGISELTVDGVAVTDYTITSSSGADYRYSTEPVPEPTSGGLAALGLGLLAAMRAARRRR